MFGFAQSLETAAAPITAFLIGPIAQFWIIPAMTDGALADLIGPWFGTGPARAMALIFIVAGTVGLLVTLVALRSRPTGSCRAVTRQLRPTTTRAPWRMPPRPEPPGSQRPLA